MAKEIIPLRNIQVTFQRSNPLTKIVVICAIVLCTIAMITLRWTQTSLERQTAEMEKKAAQLVVENQDLQDKIDDVGSVQSVQEIAQAELDLVYPDTEFFEP